MSAEAIPRMVRGSLLPSGNILMDILAPQVLTRPEEIQSSTTTYLFSRQFLVIRPLVRCVIVEIAKWRHLILSHKQGGYQLRAMRRTGALVLRRGLGLIGTYQRVAHGPCWQCRCSTSL